MKQIILTIIFLISISSSSYAQKYLNLEFDKTPGKDKPARWYTAGSGYEVKVDTEVFYSNNSSLRIKGFTKTENSFGVATGTFPLKYALGKKIKFTGYIKTKNVKDGYAGLWMRVDGPSRKTLAFDNMNSRGVTGTTEWKKYEIDLDCDTSAININFGCLFDGTGSAWFDKLEVSLDGVMYADKKPDAIVPTNAELNWIKNNSIKLNTVEAGNGFDDLQGLKDLIGGAKIIGLGEATHGTHEIFKMKHRMVEFLANEMDFTVFAIEGNMPEAYKLNDYILNGNGDPKELIGGMYFWTWDTQEVLDMVEWMRQFNSSGKGKIFFTGFDMQTTSVASQIVQNFINRNDTSFAQECEIYFKTLNELNVYNVKQKRTDSSEAFVENMTGTILNRLIDNKNKYFETNPADTVEWVIQNARIVAQGSKRNPSRDKDMADNIEWILHSFPEGTKMVLWAHNYHISRAPGAMGDFLNKKFGKDYLPIGFSIGKGKYRAYEYSDNVNWVHTLNEPYPGSYEYYFHSTGLPYFILDLRKSDASVSESSFLKKPMDFRSIGAMAMDEQFDETPLTDYFDGIIYIDNTTNTISLRPHN